MNFAEIAYKAAEIMSEHDLAKGQLSDGSGGICHNGALLIAMGIPEEDLMQPYFYLPGFSEKSWKAFQGVARGILEGRGIIVGHISEYNDLESTSREDVIMLLKETGKRLDAGILGG